MGPRTALSIRSNSCNEITYIETGCYPVACTIKKRQITFWSSLNENLKENGSLYKLLQKAKEINLPLINTIW